MTLILLVSVQGGLGQGYVPISTPTILGHPEVTYSSNLQVNDTYWTCQCPGWVRSEVFPHFHSTHTWPAWGDLAGSNWLTRTCQCLPSGQRSGLYAELRSCPVFRRLQLWLWEFFFLEPASASASTPASTPAPALAPENMVFLHFLKC